MKIKINKVKFVRETEETAAKMFNGTRILTSIQELEEYAQIDFTVHKDFLRFGGTYKMSKEDYMENIRDIEKKIADAICS